jgi:predicted dienelactone hydrolase
MRGLRSLSFAAAALLCAVLASVVGGATKAAMTTPPPVGFRQMEFTDAASGRRLAFALFYPAAPSAAARTPFKMPFAINVRVFKDAEPALGAEKHPLVVFSHGRGSNPLLYVWFAQLLAEHGYVVAAPYHYRANTYDSTIAYLANKLWQRPIDVGLDITDLLRDPYWGAHIDPKRIGVAGHSQGGFTALWVGGATVDAAKYAAFQRGWRNNESVPTYLREQLPLDPAPALAVADKRIKAVFAMAPGVIEDFGMDPAGLRKLALPTYLIVGARDTQTPAATNAEYAAKYVPHARLQILPGLVDHEIFTNECNQDGKDEFPEACVDAPGVDRAKNHKAIGAAALRFFAANL